MKFRYKAELIEGKYNVIIANTLQFDVRWKIGKTEKKHFLQLRTWRDAFLVLDLGLHVLDGVRWLHLEGDGLTGEGFDENLHGRLGGERRAKRAGREKKSMLVLLARRVQWWRRCS